MKWLNCKQASVLLSRSLDGRLSWRERWSLRLHLTVCDACTRFGQQLDFLRAALRRMVFNAERNEQLQLSTEARKRIRQALQSFSD